MIPRSRTGVLLTALRCLPLTIAWAGTATSRSKHGLVGNPRFASCDGSGSQRSPRLRTYKTPVDEYYQMHGDIPLPAVSHMVLSKSCERHTNRRRGILVIGDVHGCFEELLHEKAVEQNDGLPFEYVILAGDMVNKGPHSARVVKHVRSLANDGWRSVRGNHDNGALQAALGDASRRNKKKYQWIFDECEPLSDDDVEWMAELPYTIRIPGSMLDREKDVVIVHAGFIPGKDIDEQAISDMTTLRQVVMEKEDIDTPIYYSKADKNTVGQSYPWASLWRGTEFVIFGHDAAKGLQEHEGALGLDTGVCYGRLLTGISLPQDRIIHVRAAKAYSPIGKKDD